MKTYVVERKNFSGHDVIEYCTRLSEAKRFLVRARDGKGLSILCISGPCFGEGFHKYRLIIVCNINGFKFKRITSNLDAY